MNAENLLDVVVEHLQFTDATTKEAAWPPPHLEWWRSIISVINMQEDIDGSGEHRAAGPFEMTNGTRLAWAQGSLIERCFQKTPQTRQSARRLQKLETALGEMQYEQWVMPAFPPSLLKQVHDAFTKWGPSALCPIHARYWHLSMQRIVASSGSLEMMVSETVTVLTDWLNKSLIVVDADGNPLGDSAVPLAEQRELYIVSSLCLIGVAIRHLELLVTTMTIEATRHHTTFRDEQRCGVAASLLEPHMTELRKRFRDLRTKDDGDLHAALTRVAATITPPRPSQPAAPQAEIAMPVAVTLGQGGQALGGGLRRYDQLLKEELGQKNTDALLLGRYIALHVAGFTVPRVALLSGESGSELSEYIDTIGAAFANAFGVPLGLLRVDAHKLRPNGYAGTDVASLQERLCAMTKSGVSRGVVILDHFEAIAPEQPMYGTDDVEYDRPARERTLGDLRGLFGGDRETLVRTGVPHALESDGMAWFVVASGVFKTAASAPTRRTLADHSFPEDIIDKISLLVHLARPDLHTLTVALNRKVDESRQRYATAGLMMNHESGLVAVLARAALAEKLSVRRVVDAISRVHADAATRMILEGDTTATIGTRDDVLPLLHRS